MLYSLLVILSVENKFQKFTTCSIDLLLFFIKIKIVKATANHINITHEKYKYIDSCFEASDGRTKWDQ